MTIIILLLSTLFLNSQPPSGSLNYKGLEILREVESNGKKYYCGGILPCTADLKRVALKSRGKEKN
jgi:hypothetical protein